MGYHGRSKGDLETKQADRTDKDYFSLAELAVLPHPSFYDMQEIDSAAFIELVQEANELGQLNYDTTLRPISLGLPAFWE